MNLNSQEWIRLTKGGRNISIRLERIDAVETSASGLVVLHVNGQTINLTAPESKEFTDSMNAAQPRPATVVKSTATVRKT